MFFNFDAKIIYFYDTSFIFFINCKPLQPYKPFYGDISSSAYQNSTLRYILLIFSQLTSSLSTANAIPGIYNQRFCNITQRIKCKTATLCYGIAKLCYGIANFSYGNQTCSIAIASLISVRANYISDAAICISDAAICNSVRELCNSVTQCCNADPES